MGRSSGLGPCIPEQKNETSMILDNISLLASSNDWSMRPMRDLPNHGQDEQCDRNEHKPENTLLLSGNSAAQEKEEKAQYVYLENPHNYP